MKKIYEKPDALVLVINTEDIMQTSQTLYEDDCVKDPFEIRV